MMIKRTLHEVGIKTFTLPREGLAFIKKNFVNSFTTPSVLFLDINMPTLTGWDFLGLYANFSEEIKNQISIYLVSSSINPRDLNKAKENKYVKGFISKPLDRETILAIEEQLLVYKACLPGT